MERMNSASVPFPADAAVFRAPQISTPRAPVSSGEAWPVSILGIPFDSVNVAGALERIDAMIASRVPHYIVTANVDFLVQAHRDVELRRILLEADLVLCDGTPLVWASRFLGNALPERVAGADLAPALLAHAAQRGHRIFLLGAAPGVAAEAADRIRAQFPTLEIAGHYAPRFAPLLEMDHAEIIRQVRAAKPDILLVSFGCPKQEKWIAMHLRALGVPVAIGVGATIDFLAGRVRRAPAWMRRSGTEWLFRLALEPRRLFRRYCDDLLLFGPIFAAQALRLSRRSPGRNLTPAPAVTAGENWRCIALGRALTAATLRRDAEFWRDVARTPSHWLLDASALRRFDATGIAALARWQRQLRRAGRELVLLSPSPALRRALIALRLDDFISFAGDAAEALRQLEAATAQKPVQSDHVARALAWRGEIGAANVEDVWRATSEHVSAFAAQNTRLVVIDLSELRFIDSAAAGLMLRLKKWAQQLPVEIAFSGARPNVRNVLRLTRLDHLLLERSA
jgi:N-acetylglucosaminyldiphosphoundecaprenol N-acetyl-beta-D-mannosaminyltransferase